MSLITTRHYGNGRIRALHKLGLAGPIPYTETKFRDGNRTRDYNSQQLWKGVDDHNSLLQTTKQADYIRGDLDKIKPQRDEIRRSAIQQAFDTNDSIGKEYGLGDPPMTQPNGSEKAAFLNPLAGGSSPFKASMPKIPGMKSITAGLPKIKPQTPPGYDLKAGIQQTADGMLQSNSIFSRAARGNASPF